MMCIIIVPADGFWYAIKSKYTNILVLSSRQEAERCLANLQAQSEVYNNAKIFEEVK